MRTGRQRAWWGRGRPKARESGCQTPRYGERCSGQSSRPGAVERAGRGCLVEVPNTSLRARCRMLLQPRCPGRARGPARGRPDLRDTGGRGHAVRQCARRPPSAGSDLGLHQPVERRQDQQRRHPLPDEVRDLHLPRYRERRGDGDRAQSQPHQQRGWNSPDLILHHPICFHVRLPVVGPSRVCTAATRRIHVDAPPAPSLRPRAHC